MFCPCIQQNPFITQISNQDSSKGTIKGKQVELISFTDTSAIDKQINYNEKKRKIWGVASAILAIVIVLVFFFQPVPALPYFGLSMLLMGMKIEKIFKSFDETINEYSKNGSDFKKVKQAILENNDFKKFIEPIKHNLCTPKQMLEVYDLFRKTQEIDMLAINKENLIRGIRKNLN